MPKSVHACLLLTAILLAGCLRASAQPTNLLANPSFERGAAEPDGWSLFSLSGGGRDVPGYQSDRCVSVGGNGDDSGWWAAASAPLEPGRLYYASYWVRRQSGSGGCVIAGLTSVNRDADAGPEWGRRDFFFRVPDSLTGAFFRLGQWHASGTLQFDQVSLTPALVVHRRPAQLELALGAGEAVLRGRYSARHLLGGPGSTDFRCLDGFTATFNTNRWVFTGDSTVIYRHSLGSLRQTESEVEVSVGLRERGSLLLEASRDRRSWLRVGEASKVGRVAFPLPPDLLPAREVYLRLSTTGDASLQVDGYEYRCRLPEAEPVEKAVGQSQYLRVARLSPDLQVKVVGLGPLLSPGREAAELVVRNLGPRRMLRVALAVERGETVVAEAEKASAIAPGGTQRVELPYRLGPPGAYRVRLSCSEAAGAEALWEADGEFRVTPLLDSGGELLSLDRDLAISWCEPERKVGRDRPLPERKGTALRISAAANEYEAAQLVLTPRRPIASCRLTPTDLVSDSGARLPASQVEIRMVDYVFVASPTDEVGTMDDWPDPLPPLRGPVDLAAGRSQPFWVTLHVPAGTPPGDYRGHLIFAADGLTRRIPLLAHVWGFELPRETHVRSGLGLDPGLIRRYHNLETEAEFNQVFNLYLESFAAHRVCPYSVGAGIEVTWDRTPAGRVAPQLDFSRFDDAAHRALDQLGFNSFLLGLDGLGGGTFQSRYLGDIAGFKMGSPQHEEAFALYARAIQSHLAARGWLDKAYVYWFDEPEQKDFDFVRQGMDLIHRAAPDLTRMLTTHPNPLLYGAVDLWCLPTYTLDPDVVRARQALGEEVWWYLCTGPKAPYFTLFLDHYGTEIRLWLWETWKYGLDGILVWSASYWTSGTAYPSPALQNPWQDPMSWVSGYGTEAGLRQPWGNGDGRFLYPPTRDPADIRTKYLEGPVPSIRWELLRDGIEDYEYFHLLRQQVDRLKQSGADPSLYQPAEQLLEVPLDVCADLTTFTVTPEPLHAHRARLAQAIEQLQTR